jgi:Conserved TM helix
MTPDWTLCTCRYALTTGLRGELIGGTAIDLEGGLEAAWDSTITFLPTLLGFLLILGIGYVAAKAVEKLLDKILERVGSIDSWRRVPQVACAAGGWPSGRRRRS